MEKKISNAFTYLFKDPEWKFKSFIIYMISIVPLGLMYFTQTYMKTHMTAKTTQELSSISVVIGVLMFTQILSLVLSILMSGYENKSLHNLIYQEESSENPIFLASWEENIGELLRIGLFYFFAILLFLLSMFLLMGIGLLFSKIIPIVSAIFIIISAIIMLIFSFYVPALQAIFATKYELNSFFRFKKAQKVVGYGTGNYLKILFIMFLASIVTSIVVTLLKSSIFLFIIAPFLTTYTFFVYIYLKGILIPYNPDEFFYKEDLKI